MQRVLKVCGKNLYIKSNGKTTRRLAEAYNVPDISTAIHFCRLHGLTGIELLLKVNGPEFDITIPMGDELQD